MALKKGVFQDYIKKQESSELKEFIEKKRNQYTHNKVFSTPSFEKVDIDKSETGNKQQTTVKTNNKPQSKPKTNINQNLKQTQNKPKTKSTLKKQTHNKPATKPITNIKQTPNDLTHEITFANLSGLQRDVILAMYENCRILGGRVTQELTLEYLSKKINGNKLSIKTSILRLKNKNYIKQVGFKNGRGGWTKYELSKQLHADIIHHDMYVSKSINGEQTYNKLQSKHITEPTTNASSSNNSINNITTIEKIENELSEVWKNINISPLQAIGFSVNNLKQLVNLNNPEVIQDSIYRFAYTLQHDPKVKEKFENPLRVIMGVLRKGEGWSEPNYESPKDRSLRELLERKKAEKAKRDQMIQELVKLEFPDWEKTLTPEERQRIVPPEKALNTDWNNSPEKLLRDHFANVVLPKRLEEEGA